MCGGKGPPVECDCPFCRKGRAESTFADVPEVELLKAQLAQARVELLDRLEQVR